MVNQVFNKLLTGSSRSDKIKKNIFYMFFIKGGSILAGLLIVPMTLSYVDSETYGVWLTLSSMVAWMSFFDIGLNQGLRNKLAECFAYDNYDLGKKYVSTAYAILILLFIPLMLILLIVTPFINWENLLNLTSVNHNELLSSICIIIGFFCINFILNTINIVLLADQRPADASLRSLIQQITSILILFILTKITKGNLVLLCLGLCVSPLLVVTLFSFTLFGKRYKLISPDIKYVDFGLTKDLLKLGVQFFIIQIAGIIQYQLVNFLIIRYYGASEVTSYNIAYKLFSVLTMVWGIFTAPLWSAVTDAYTKGEYAWIHSILNKYLIFFLIFLLAGVLLLFTSPFIYKMWIGESVDVTFSLSFWVLLFNITMMFGSVFVSILNGVGKLKIQSIVCLISPLVFFAVSFFLIDKGMGVYSILIGSIVANFNGVIIAPIQVLNLLNRIDKDGKK